MLRNHLLESVHAYIGSLVHPSARADGLTFARHRAFIATRLLGGLCVLAILPVYFALRGAPTPLEAAVLGWLLSPLLLAGYLSRTGRHERAHLISAGMLAALVAVVATATGGLFSFAAPWIALIPLEAAFSASRRVVNATIAIAIATLFGLWGLGVAGSIPPPSATDNGTTLHFLGALSATLYAGAIALGAGTLAGIGERAKHSGEARYRLLAQHMTDVITRHRRNGAVTFVSPAAERLVGTHTGELLGHGLFERVHVADRPAFLTAIANAAQSGQATSVEYRLRRDGPDPAIQNFVWVESRCRAVGETGADKAQAQEIVCVTRDISRRKADAEALESARAEADRANQAKSRFLATVSHELRTPLNAIIGFSEILAQEQAMAVDPVRRQDYARLIRDSGQHLLALVNGILDVSRIEAGHLELSPEPFAPGPLLESCCQMMQLRAEQAGLRFRLNLPSDLPEIVVDKRALRQIAINLISNAIKFTDRNGAVEVSAHVQGDELRLVVADTGIGIGEDDLAQIGAPFFQARSSYDRPYEGAGLGLSVVKGLVDLHGGRMEITSRIGEGTRVLICLPRRCRGTASSRTNEKVVEPLPRRPEATQPEQVKRRA